AAGVASFATTTGGPHETESAKRKSPAAAAIDPRTLLFFRTRRRILPAAAARFVEAQDARRHPSQLRRLARRPEDEDPVRTFGVAEAEEEELRARGEERVSRRHYLGAGDAVGLDGHFCAQRLEGRAARPRRAGI